MQKRTLAFILISSMLVTMYGCGTQSSESTETQSAEEETTEAETTTSDADYTTGTPWIDSDILSNVESAGDVDLKDDFALSQNGQWVKDNPIADGEVRNNFLTSFEEELNSRLLTIMQDDTETEDHNAQLVRSMYSAFLDWDERDAKGTDCLKPYLEEIEEIENYDGLVDYTLDDDFHLTSVVKTKTNVNPEDASQYIVAVVAMEQFLSDPADYDDIDNLSGTVQATYDYYKNRVKLVLSQCGYDDSQIDEIFDGAIQFEKLLAANRYTVADSSLTETSETINKQLYTPDELQEYKWYDIVEKQVENYGVTDIPKVQLYEKLDYFENLDSILTDENNIDLIKDYLLAHTASSSASYLDKDTFYKTLDLYNERYGSSGYEEEEQYAIKRVSDTLGWSLSRLYCDQYVTAEDKENMLEVINETVEGYKEMLQDEDFLSDETKEKAIEKLDNLRINCMYPDDWSDYDYSDLTISDNYFDDVLAISKYETAREFKDFNKPVNKDLWVSTPITMNAFYSPKNNSINILPGLIGNVLYNSDMSKEEVYGMAGVVIGHEISHAFDPSGANYDSDGNYISWWTDEDYEKFNEKTDKLVAYYDNITVWDGFNCSGELDKTEACADMGGVAVMLHLAAKDSDFDYQSFFEAYARTWATNMTTAFAYQCGMYDSHPLPYLRINVTVAQFDEFYDTYDIQEGDGMYIAADDRVKIW